MRTVLLCIVLIAGRALAQNAPAQNAPEKAVRDIRDVQIGMSRDHVLAGLGDKYDLTRIDTAKIAEEETWMVWPKDDPKRATRPEDGAIRFWEGKVLSVDISLYPSMSGEGSLFAERLFWLLYNRADLPAPPTTLCGVELHIGMPKNDVISRLGNNCKVQPITPSPSFWIENQMGISSTPWCVNDLFPCSHTVWFEGETLSAVKQDKFYTEYNPRWVTLPVELQDRHDDKGEVLKVSFTLDGQDFSITLRKPQGQPTSVDVEQHISGVPTKKK